MLKFFRLPFATTGDKTAVPDDVDTNGNVSYSQGYGFDYQRRKTDPAAKNIERDKMNQILFDVTNAVAELQAQGVPDFITSALNGGAAYSYEQFAVVRYSGDLYISLAAANTADPTDATKWALLPTPARIQAAFNTSAVAAGTANALTAVFAPAIAALPAAPGTLSVLVRAGSANTTTTPTFSPDGLTAKTIVKGNNLPLVAGDIAGAGHWLDLQYDATLDEWILQNPATGISVTAKQIQALTAAVAANALTVTYGGGTLDFRNASLSNGTPVSAVAVPSNAITVPSGATLGTVSGQAARLVFLEAYNGGSPVLCVANIAGGLQLDETNLISPTTISAGATSAGVIYSASAVSANSPYRVVGFIDITEATAGTWATDATLEQGIGGQALAALSSLGYGQTWQDVTGSRAKTTTYYNTTGKPITLRIRYTSGTGTIQITVNGSAIAESGGASGFFEVQTVIQPGLSYSFAGIPSINSVWELR